MDKFKIDDLEMIKHADDSTVILKKQLASMLANSNGCRAIIESLNRKTGEYRIIVQGTLQKNE